MKGIFLSLLAMLLLAVQAVAGDAVSLEFKDLPLPAALTRVQDASGLRLAFSNDLVRDAEPVTLSAKDEPVDAVLLRMLRPRGFECIYTGETMAAVVRADTDAGMAKAAGRALRTFARLERKLEKAVQVGDEVKVPEWTDEDDRALAEGIVDLATAAYFFNQRKRETGGKPFDLARLLNIFDKDVRVGTCCPATETRGQETRSPEELAALEAAVRKAIDDPDPEIRATGIFLVACVNRLYGDKWAPVVQKVVDACTKDPAPEPRFAITLAFASGGLGRAYPQGEILSTSRSDANPSVRGVAWVLWLDQQRRTAGPELLDEFRQAIIAEKNPILRSLGVIMALMFCERNHENVAQLCNAPEVQADPWLKVSAGLMLGIAEMMTTGRDSSRSKDEGAAAEIYAQARQKMLDTTIALLTSGKRSHQLLAGLSSLFGMRAMLATGQKQPKPDLSKITALADSDDLWERFLGIMTSAAAGDQAGTARLLKALESKDQLDRISALIACTMSRPSTNPNADAAEIELSKKLTAAIFALLRSPLLPEKYLAAEAIRGRVPFDDLLAMLQDEIRRSPNSDLAKLLVTLFGDHRELQGNDEVSNQRQMMVLDTVFESKNAELEILFIQNMNWWSLQNQPLILTLICDCEPEVLSTMLAANRNLSYRLGSQDFAIEAMLERLKTLLAQNDPRVRLTAVKGLASYVRSSPNVVLVEKFRATTLELSAKMLDAFILQGNTPEQFAAGCDLLCATLEKGRTRRWGDLPVGIRAAAVRVLGVAGDPARAAKAAAVLGLCYSHGGSENAEFAPVMEAARRKIMASDRPADQAVVLCGMAISGDAQLRDPAVAELGKRLMDGTLPAANRNDTVQALSGMRVKLSDDFLRFALAKLSDHAEDSAIRQSIVGSLSTKPAVYGELIDTLAELAKSGEPEPVYTPWLSSLSGRLKHELATLKDKNQPVPAWAAKAAELGLQIMNDTARTPDQRTQGMGFYARVAGPAASAMLEKTALDPKADPNMRRQAVSLAAETNPESKIFATLAENYATLPTDMRRDLGQTAARAKNAAGAEPLVIAHLKDQEIGSYRIHALSMLDLPATPTLIAALKELEQDKDLGPHVKNVIERLQRQNKQ